MKRFRVVAVLLVMGFVASACADGVVIIGDPGPEECPRGECDNLEATVASIDWLGDGTSPDAVASYDDGEPDYPLQTNVWHVELADADVTHQHIVDRLSDAEFEPVPDRKSSFQGDEWQIAVKVLFGEGSLKQVKVIVDIVDDARAAEILAPIIDALGTIS